MLQLNTLLDGVGVDPSKAIVARHRPHEPQLRRVMPWIAAERPDLFKVYQQTHWVKLEAALTRAETLVAFLGHEAKKALFVAIYEIKGSHQISYDEYWAISGNQTLRDHGMRGLRPDDPAPLLFDLSETDLLAEWKGRLVVTWPGLERSWWRWANRNVIPVSAITEESKLARDMPPWEELVLSWIDLDVLPTSWKAALSQWRGVYFIFDTAQQRGYVGSAYGSDNLWGRWLNYAATGHGGNKRLRDCNPADLRFSILQRTSPDTEPDVVIALEGRWKSRLHTREHGFNEN